MARPRVSFDPRRLRIARQAAGKRKSELADLLGISAASVTQYEAGRTVPRPAVLGRMALVLGCPAEYLADDPVRKLPTSTSATSFRSLRSTRQWERDQAEALTELVWEVIAYVDELVELPPVDLPEIPLDFDAEKSAIERAADEVRAAWQIPPGPIGHVLRLLEAHGLVVARLAGLSERLDAFSRWFDDRPLVVLVAGPNDKARSRFNTAHELGHLVMHPDPEPGDRLREQQAHRFAAALLMPGELIIDELPRRPPYGDGWHQLLDLKMRWGVSLAALLFRARDLGTLSEASYRRAITRLSELGWRRREPGDLGLPEEPLLLRNAVDALLADKKDLVGLSGELCWPVNRLEDLLGVRRRQAPHAGQDRRGQLSRTLIGIAGEPTQ